MTGNPFWDNAHFHIPNYLLALAMYLVMGRILLGLLVPSGAGYIARSFARLTDPLIGLVAKITPAGLPPLVLQVFTFFWVFLARIGLYVAYAAAGLAPTAG